MLQLLLLLSFWLLAEVSCCRLSAEFKNMYKKKYLYTYIVVMTLHVSYKGRFIVYKHIYIDTRIKYNIVRVPVVEI